MDHEPYLRQLKADATNRWLLISLLVSLAVLPLLEGFAGRTLLLLGLTSTFVLGKMAARKRFPLLILVLVIVALPLTWATLFVDWKPLFVAHCLLGSAFFWLVAGVVVFVVIKNHLVTVDSVFGAISAYLLLGLAWALSYWAIHTVSPNSFKIPNGGDSTVNAEVSQVADFSQFIYYSFVTMTTLGYGDMTPTDRITRTLSWIQSVTGQFYVAVLIAWLVSALPRPGKT